MNPGRRGERMMRRNNGIKESVGGEVCKAGPKVGSLTARHRN